MKTRPGKTGEILDRSLALFNNPSPEEVEVSRELALKFLESTSAEGASPEDLTTDSIRSVHKWRWPLAVGMAAAVAVAVIIPKALPRSAPGTFQTAKGALRVEYGDLVRSPEAAGDVLVLADGSNIEMRADSELSLEPAEDGVLIRLTKGGIIVRAVEQRAGHLYVQTKDVSVSVVGTVFLVKAEEQGSRVAVIEGEVRVEKGSEARKLLPGEQVRTDPSMPPVPVIDEIAWSRNAAAHTALLQAALASLQAAVSQRPTGAQQPGNPGVPPEHFEVISIKPYVPPPAVPGAPGGGGGGGGMGAGGGSPCGSSSPQLDPRRFYVANATTLRLITWAYGVPDCRAEIGIVSGGPDWVREDRYEVDTRIPEGATSYGRLQLTTGAAPQLQRMLQMMLRDRFKLSLRRETRDMPVLELVVERPGEMQPSVDQSIPPDPFDPFAQGADLGRWPGGGPPPGTLVLFTGARVLQGTQISMPKLVQGFQARQTRLVIDRTGLKGLFDIRVPVFLDPASITLGRPPDTDSQVLDYLGLKLQPSRAPVEVFIIDNIERPSEN